MTPPASVSCPTCGAPASGKFCSECGATLAPRACPHCQADLSAQARFCHHCGKPVGGAGSDRKAWFVAGAVCVLLVGGIAYNVMRDTPAPAAPDMANAGSSTGLEGTGPSGTAPDISAMTPRERFDRLYNRIMQASERSDSAEVARFTPMALGAYQQLEARDADARYHAAVLQMQVGNFPAARALADTIVKDTPGHLFGYVIRGTAARLENDSATLARARKDFLAHYDTEMRLRRAEYLDHQPVIDEFKKEASSPSSPSAN
ncbi:MAG: zinc ribbon domain-containing protein [Gemmatimonadales bacterium]